MANGKITFKTLSTKDQNKGVVLRATVRSSSDGRRVYVVTKRRTWMCDCPHNIYRHPKGGCKHIKAVRAAAK